MKTDQRGLTELLLIVISCLLAASVAIQGFFVSKVWDHEGRISILETRYAYSMENPKKNP